MASRILDMGDVLTLIEQAERAFDKRQTDEMARKFLAEEDFTFDDFLEQMSAIKKMGSLKSMLKMMPGTASLRAEIDSFDEREFDRVEAMVRSMTPYERTHPKQINGSRRACIAGGSGVTVSEVNQLLERFAAAQKMMKQLARGGGAAYRGCLGSLAPAAVGSSSPSARRASPATRPSGPPRSARRGRARGDRPHQPWRCLRPAAGPTRPATARPTCRPASRSTSKAGAGSPPPGSAWRTARGPQGVGMVSYGLGSALGDEDVGCARVPSQLQRPGPDPRTGRSAPDARWAASRGPRWPAEAS